MNTKRERRHQRISIAVSLAGVAILVAVMVGGVVSGWLGSASR